MVGEEKKAKSKQTVKDYEGNSIRKGLREAGSVTRLGER
jgi:hypothetical protein